MGKVRVDSFAISADGFGAGPDQDLQNPLGIGGRDLHNWVFPTRSFQRMHGGGKEGTLGVDNDFAEASFINVGAWIMGRNMFGPVRGPWPNENWKGWWGPNPPYHVPTFVLTHHGRPPLEMEGGTVFHFVTGGLDEAMALARAAAGAADVRIGGGVATVREGLAMRLIDRMHLVQSPVLLGRGESLLAGLDLKALGYAVTGKTPSDAAMHLVIERQPV